MFCAFEWCSFAAESEREKKEWIEALQDSIAETLSDYEVAEKIWSNKSNRACADCKAQNPDWASINLCVVICKKCAGNEKANRFWAARVTPGEELDTDATIERRREFIKLKYRDGTFRGPHPKFATQDELIK
eukprot:g31438.t1